MPRSAFVTILSCSFLLALISTSRAGVIVDTDDGQTTPRAANVHTPTPVALEGVVLASRSFWDRGRIVTESVVRTDHGDEVRVRQPGGTVDDLSQVQFPSPALLSAGDRVSLIMDGTRPDLAQPILQVLALEHSAKHDETYAETDDGPIVQKYVRTTNDFLIPLYWEASCIQVTYHAAGTTHLDGELEFDVLDSIFETWRNETQSCSYLTFDILPPEEREAELDRINMIIFREDFWGRPGCPDDPNQCHQSSAAAVTTVSYVNSETSDRAGEIVDADIEMNGVHFGVSANGLTNSDSACLSDLANTMTHEVGHMMGLEHTCLIAPPRDTKGDPKPFPQDHEGNEIGFCSPNDSLELQATTMYPTQECGETIKITPEVDDIAGVCGMYPLAEDPGVCRPPGSLTTRSCACATGARPDGQTTGTWLFALLSLLAFVLWRRRKPNARSAMASIR